MTVRQYAFHFNLPQGCLVCVSAAVSFLLVFVFGIYIGKEVQAYKTAQQTRIVRFPVEPADHNVSVNPAPQTFPLTSKKISEKPKGPGGWSIQVHVTKSPSTARQLAAELATRGYTPSVNRLTKNGETLYRVRVGTFPQEEARRVAAQFRREERFSQAYPVSD